MVMFFFLFQGLVARHFGKHSHPQELHHLFLRDSDQQEILPFISNDQPNHSVIQKLAERHLGHAHNRLQLLNADDIKNIRVKYGFRASSRLPDATATKNWIEENHDDVLFWKLQDTVDDINGLRDDDCVIVIMKKTQKAMLEKFGSFTFYVDSTHGTNAYDFHLTTLMVADEHGEGYPVAFMFSNKEDKHVMGLFFRTLREAMGGDLPHPQFFLTDDSPVFL